MKLRHLQHFVAVAQTLNFHRAADRLHLSQQAVSKSIIQLEQQLGLRLLERGRQSVILTEQGAHLLPFALEVVSSARRFEDAVSSTLDGRHGSLAVGATPTFQESILPGALGQFQTQYPQTPVSVERGDFTSLCAAMMRGDLDIILSTAPSEIPRQLVKPMVIGQDRNVIVVRAGHPLASLPRVTCADLLAFPRIETMNFPRGHAYVMRLFMTAGLAVPRPVLNVGATVLGMERVEHTESWWVTPRLQVWRRLQAGAFVALPMEEPDDSWDLIMAIRRHAVPSRWTSSFQTIIKACLDDFSGNIRPDHQS